MANKRFIKRAARDLIALTIVVIGIGVWQTRDLLPSGQPAPPLAGLTLNEQHFSLKEHAGKTVLVYFFAPWCGVCKVSAGNLEWVEKLTDDDDTTVVAVALEYENRASIDAFAQAVGLGPVPAVIGSDDIRDQYKINAYPSYYVIKSDGTVASASIGYSTLLGMLIRTWIAG